MKPTKLLICIALLLFGASSMADELGQFERVDTKTFDKKKFVFPDDMSGGKLNVLFLSLSSSRENGEEQMNSMFEWQTVLEERGVFNDDVRAYHFSVAAGVPFFVKGIMTRAMRKSYQDHVPPNQSGVLLVDDLDDFAAAPKIEVDGQPTLVLVSTDGAPLQVFKGPVSDAAVDGVIAAIGGLLAGR